MSKELKKEEREKINGGVKKMAAINFGVGGTGSMNGNNEPINVTEGVAVNNDKLKAKAGIVTALASFIGIASPFNNDMK